MDSRPETYEHIGRVRTYLGDVIVDLLNRAERHDASKLRSPELEVFDEFTPALRTTEYGSEEYKANVKAMGPAIQHHYEANDHHPEHFENGIRGMSLMSLLEMLVDWKAASERTRPSAGPAPRYGKDFVENLRLNQERFGFSDELLQILENTARELCYI
jgi:hypothetical protein